MPSSHRLRLCSAAYTDQRHHYPDISSLTSVCSIPHWPVRIANHNAPSRREPHGYPSVPGPSFRLRIRMCASHIILQLLSFLPAHDFQQVPALKVQETHCIRLKVWLWIVVTPWCYDILVGLICKRSAQVTLMLPRQFSYPGAALSVKSCARNYTRAFL